MQMISSESLKGFQEEKERIKSIAGGIGGVPAPHVSDQPSCDDSSMTRPFQQEEADHAKGKTVECSPELRTWESR
jgi:hypothetical protein